MRSYEECETIVLAFQKSYCKLQQKFLTIDNWYFKKVKQVKPRASQSQTTDPERGLLTQWSTYTKDRTAEPIRLRKLENYFTSTGSCRSK